MSIVLPEIADWSGFYVTVGSAAGALIGLQFVVITLIAARPPADAVRAGAAFASPTIVHFAAALLLAEFAQAPWRTMVTLAALWAIMGISGVIYALIVGRRMRTQTAYRPAFEDWLFHVAAPIAAYAVLAASAFVARWHWREALFGVGACALLLLFTGIHNAWDSAAYHVLVTGAGQTQSGSEEQQSRTQGDRA
jgi:hypothetical protein